MEPFLVGNDAVDIFGVDVLVVDDEFGVFMVLAEQLNGVLYIQFSFVIAFASEEHVWWLLTKALPANDGRKVELGVAVDGGLDSSLQVHGPALVQPAASTRLAHDTEACSHMGIFHHSQMLPTCIRYQVSTPAVTQLMRDNVHVLAITADDGGCGEGVDRVLHACG